MRHAILLLTTMAVVLLLVGGMAASKQLQKEQSTSSQSTTTDKSGDDVLIQGSAVKASFASGSGANFLGVKVSDHGNLLSFESPAGQDAALFGTPSEGYVVCSSGTQGQTVHGHDTGVVEGGFGTPTFAQPNGAGTFPLTVTRNTTDGKFQLKQVWAKPDAVEKDVTVTMTLKNRTTSPIATVILHRTGDFDVGSTISDHGARTSASAWQWDDQSSATDSPATGLILTGITLGSAPFAFIESRTKWNDPTFPTRQRCSASPLTTPTGRSDLTMRVGYTLGSIGAGQSKTVKFEYGRM